MSEKPLQKAITREVIVARLAQKSYHLVDCGSPASYVFGAPFDAPEISEPLFAYVKDKETVKESIRQLQAGGWSASKDLKEILEKLEIFSDYDIYLLCLGISAGDLGRSFKSIFEEYKFCYNL